MRIRKDIEKTVLASKCDIPEETPVGYSMHILSRLAEIEREAALLRTTVAGIVDKLHRQSIEPEDLYTAMWQAENIAVRAVEQMVFAKHALEKMGEDSVLEE